MSENNIILPDTPEEINEDYTHITVVLDRSGSMRSVMEEAEGSFNRFISEQKEVDGKATITLVQFDDLYEVVYNGIDIKDVPEYKLIPRGWTHLLDAIGKAIVETDEFISGLYEKPAKIIMVIITDGKENRSEEYTREQIAELTKEHEKKEWKFMYLGANQNAFDEAGKVGISAGHSLSYNGGSTGTIHAFAAATSAVTRLRKMRYNEYESTDNLYTDTERLLASTGDK